MPATETSESVAWSRHGVRPGISLESLTGALVFLYVALGAAAYLRFADRSYLRRLLEPELWSTFLYVAPIGAIVLLIYYRLAARTADGTRVRGMRAGWHAAWAGARRGAFSGRRLGFAVATMVAAPLFFNAFAAWKALIPIVHPYSSDLILAHVDAVIHGGPPERLVAWVPPVLADRIYFFAWGELLVVTLVVLAWRAETRILMAFALTWIVLGTVTATIASSAGPPYFLSLTGRDDYAGLFAGLATAKGGPLIALRIQQNLWSVYQSGAVAAASGISAFPSMHVAIPSLLMFATWSRSRPLSIVLGGFTLVILVSSVALGWHYAVDGYAGIAGAGLIWLLVAKLPVRAALGEANAPGS